MSASSACFGTTQQSPCSSSTRPAATSHRHLPRLTSSVCRHFLCPPHFAGKNFVVVHFDSGRSHGRSLRGDCFDLFDLLPHGHPRSFGWCQLCLAKMAMEQASSSQSQRSMGTYIAAPQGTSNACVPRVRTCAGRCALQRPDRHKYEIILLHTRAARARTGNGATAHASAHTTPHAWRLAGAGTSGPHLGRRIDE